MRYRLGNGVSAIYLVLQEPMLEKHCSMRHT